MIELYYAVSDRKTGEEVLRDHRIFDSYDEFWFDMKTRYGYTERDYTFVWSGKEIKAV